MVVSLSVRANVQKSIVRTYICMYAETKNRLSVSISSSTSASQKMVGQRMPHDSDGLQGKVEGRH
jgi:hypothetical protein